MGVDNIAIYWVIYGRRTGKELKRFPEQQIHKAKKYARKVGAVMKRVQIDLSSIENIIGLWSNRNILKRKTPRDYLDELEKEQNDD